MFQWVYPKAQCAPRNVIGEVDFRNDDHIKCDGSEALQIAPLVGLYLMTFFDVSRSPMMRCFLLLCDVLDLLTNLKRHALGRISAEQLRDAIKAHLAAFLDAYGGIGWKPKHHWAYELWRMLARFGFLLGLLVTERRHKIVKRRTKDTFNLDSFEQGVVEEITLQHLQDLREPWLTGGLVHEVQPSSKLMRELRCKYPQARFIASSRTARVNHMLFTVGDVALCRTNGVQSAGEIFVFARIDDESVVCVSLWQRTPTANDTTWTHTYRKDDRPQILPLTTLLAPVTYLANSTTATLLIPCMFR